MILYVKLIFLKKINYHIIIFKKIKQEMLQGLFRLIFKNSRTKNSTYRRTKLVYSYKPTD